MFLDGAWYDGSGGRGIGVDGRDASPLRVLSTPVLCLCSRVAVADGGGAVPIYSAVIKKELVGTLHKWSNQYFVNAGNDIEAADVAENSIAFVEQSIHRTNVHAYEINVRQAGTGHLGIERGVDITGVYSIPSGSQMLPLWNVVMVSMSSGVDRNDRKFLRLPLYAADIQTDGLQSAFKTDVDSLYCANLLLIPGLVNTWGRPFVNASTSNLVHDRQVGHHRRARPGFKRGWVPV